MTLYLAAGLVQLAKLLEKDPEQLMEALLEKSPSLKELYTVFDTPLLVGLLPLNFISEF